MEEDSLQFVPIFERGDRDFEGRDENRENDGDVDGSDDEEQTERDAYELERDILAFRDEPRVKNNVYPESEEESSEEEDEDGAHGHRQRNREYTQSAKGLLEENMVFFNRVAFVDAVVKYVCRTGRNLQQYRYDTNKIAYKCAGGNECSWRIYCSRVGRTDEWKVRIFNKVHSCALTGRCSMMKVPVIARLFLDKIREEPEYFMPAKMESYMYEKWKVKATRHQCQAARKKVLRWIEKEYAIQFARLRDYSAEIVKSNPDSTIAIETESNREGQDVFRRFYVCFAQLRTTWKEICRPLIGVDGCFMKGKRKERCWWR